MKQKTFNPGKNKASTPIIIFLTLLMLGFSSISILSQSVKISDNGSTLINPSAVMDIESNTKGILIPSMPFNDIINNIPPFDGLIVYNTTDHHLMFFNGSSGLWEPVGAASFPLEKIIDSDLDSYVTVEHGPDDDIIRFVVAGTERWKMRGKALEPINSGSSVFIGEGAGNNDAHDNQNVFIGRHAGYSTTTGSFNTAIGHNAFESNISGADNTGLGDYALHKNTNGSGNTAIGDEAMKENTTGNSNVAIGTDALYNNKGLSNLVAIGDSALYHNGVSSIGFQGFWNTAVGSQTLFTNDEGFGNTAIGYKSLYSNSSGVFNSGFGSNALYNNASGSNNTAIGVSALYTNSSGSDNTALGVGALNTNSTANRNIAIGTNTLFSNSTGHGNIGIGVAALNSSSIQNQNIAIGDSALYHNGTGASGMFGQQNTAIGTKAMYANMTGHSNTAIGFQALMTTINGLENTTVGFGSGQRITTGSNNTFLGSQSGIHTQGGGYNVFIGAWAGKNNTTGGNNVYIGEDAGKSNFSGSNNVIIGENAGYSISKSQNVMIGQAAGYTNSGGTGNVFIGHNSGYNESGSNKLYIENSNSTSPLIYGDFATDSININGKAKVTNNLHVGGNLYLAGNLYRPEKAGYFSIPPAAFMPSNERYTRVGELTCITQDEEGEINHHHTDYHIEGVEKNRIYLKSDGYGLYDRTYFYAPVHLPHGAEIDSLYFSFEFTSGSPNVYVCGNLIKSNIQTGVMSPIWAVVLSGTSPPAGPIAYGEEAIPSLYAETVDNNHFVYSFRVVLPSEFVLSGGIVGASIKYIE